MFVKNMDMRFFVTQYVSLYKDKVVLALPVADFINMESTTTSQLTSSRIICVHTKKRCPSNGQNAAPADPHTKFEKPLQGGPEYQCAETDSQGSSSDR